MRNIRILSLVACAVLALMAIGSATASAANLLRASVSPATWGGPQVSEKLKFSLFSDEGPGTDFINCTGSIITGESVALENSSVTMTPDFGGCGSGYSAGVWKMNGCKLRFNAGSGSEPVATVDIVSCTQPMSFEFESCRIDIGNQSGLGTVKYVNGTEAGHKVITAAASLNNVTYTRSGVGCGGIVGTNHKGLIAGEWKVKGFATGGAQADVWHEIGPVYGFNVEEAPATISGVRNGSAVVMANIGGNAPTCQKQTFAGTLASLSSEAMTFTPSYAECEIEGKTVSNTAVSMGGCSYKLYSNAEAKFEIVGATCASSPITITSPWTGCVTTIGPQSGMWFSGSYTNEGSGATRTFSLAGTSSGMTYTNTGSGCSKIGTLKGGSIRLYVKFSATNSKGSQQGLWLG